MNALKNPTRDMHVVASLTLTFTPHPTDPCFSCDGNIADQRLSVAMIDAAVDVIEGQKKLAELAGGILVPSRYVPVQPDEKAFPLVAVGDQPPAANVGIVGTKQPAVLHLSLLDSGALRIDGGEIKPRFALKMLGEARRMIAGQGATSTETLGTDDPVFETPTTRFITP